MEKMHLIEILSRLDKPQTDTQKIALAWADALAYPRYNRGRTISNARIRACLATLRREFGTLAH